MNDTEILNWIEDNVFCIKITRYPTVIVKWIDKYGNDRRTRQKGTDLRVVINRAKWQDEIECEK